MLTHDGLRRLVEQFLYRDVNLIAMRPFTEKLLCSPLDPAIRYTPFFYGLLPGDHRVFALRPFCIPLDLPVIYNWIQEYCTAPGKNPFSPVQQLLEAYHDLLTADYSQSLVAEVDGTPILQIDIIRADQDEIRGYSVGRLLHKLFVFASLRRTHELLCQCAQQLSL